MSAASARCEVRGAEGGTRGTRAYLALRTSRFAALRVALATIATIALTPSLNQAHAQDSGIEVGSPAPNALLETLDGKPAELSRWIGKVPVVMEFWATWCPNCKQLEPHLLAMHRKYGKQVRFVTVAVSINQSPARIKQYVAKHRTPGEVLFDRKGNATGAYDVAATSFVVIVDRNGKVVYTGLGGKQELEGAIARVAR